MSFFWHAAPAQVVVLTPAADVMTDGVQEHVQHAFEPALRVLWHLPWEVQLPVLVSQAVLVSWQRAMRAGLKILEAVSVGGELGSGWIMDRGASARFAWAWGWGRRRTVEEIEEGRWWRR